MNFINLINFLPNQLKEENYVILTKLTFCLLLNYYSNSETNSKFEVTGFNEFFKIDIRFTQKLLGSAEPVTEILAPPLAIIPLWREGLIKKRHQLSSWYHFLSQNTNFFLLYHLSQIKLCLLHIRNNSGLYNKECECQLITF